MYDNVSITPYPVNSWELISLEEAWHNLAREHAAKPTDVLLSQEDIEKLSAVYFHWKELLIPGQTVSLTDMHDLIYCLHFDVILEMYLIRKYGFLFGSYYPDNEDFLQI